MITHTHVILEVSEAVYTEIERKLRAAGYDHAFDGDVIDMHGIALSIAARPVVPTSRVPAPVAKEVVKCQTCGKQARYGGTDFGGVRCYTCPEDHLTRERPRAERRSG